MLFNYKNVLIYGYGKSGKAVEKILIDINVKYNIYDDKFLKHDNEFINKISKKIIKQFDLIVISPAISIFNKFVKYAIKNNIKVISELEFAFLFNKSKIIAVTGTNGKTTTVKLISHVLNKCNIKCGLYGNVGIPFSENYFNKDKLCVLEVSSFQLEAISSFKPDIGVILNIDSDHLDRHKTLKNYIDTKYNLLKNQTMNDISIINKNYSFSDNEINIKSKKIYLNGYYITNINGDIVLNVLNSEQIVINNIEFDNINTNIDNIQACILVCLILGLDLYDIIQAIKSFKIDSYRLETVLIKNGVKYINDSKATNIHATTNALKMLKNDNVYLMLGGYDKKLDYNNFFLNLPKNVSKIILFGNISNRLFKVAKKYKFYNIVKYKRLLDAINYVKDNALKNSTVLFSPSCSSFDEFSSYKERAKFFNDNIK